MNRNDHGENDVFDVTIEENSSPPKKEKITQKVDAEELKWRQSLSLDEKILLTNERIIEWFERWHGYVYVSFSGGKDSTVLLHLVRNLYPDVPAVFVDTGLEFPEIKQFVKTIPNVTTLRPKKTFPCVLKEYGYPVVSKETSQKIYEVRTTKSEKLRKKRLFGDKKGHGMIPKKWQYLIDAPFKISSSCCDVMKKRPVKKYEKETGFKPFVGIMAGESYLRTSSYMKSGCNSFDATRPISRPIAFWTEDDIWEYIKRFNVPYSKIYDMGYERTGCMFCMFGVDQEDHPNRFEKMRETHPGIYNYCMNTLGCREVLEELDVTVGEEVEENPSSLYFLQDAVDSKDGEADIAEYYDKTASGEMPLEQAEERGDAYHGRNVIWIGQDGHMLRVDPDYLEHVDGNIFDFDKLRAIKQGIEQADEKLVFYAPYGTAQTIGLNEVRESIQYQEYDTTERPLTTGDEDLDAFLANEDEYIEDNYDEDDWEEVTADLNRQLVEAEENEDGDLGQITVTIRDGNHRAFGALMAGERYLWVIMDDNQYQSMEEDGYEPEILARLNPFDKQTIYSDPQYFRIHKIPDDTIFYSEGGDELFDDLIEKAIIVDHGSTLPPTLTVSKSVLEEFIQDGAVLSERRQDYYSWASNISSFGYPLPKSFYSPLGSLPVSWRPAHQHEIDAVGKKEARKQKRKSKTEANPIQCLEVGAETDVVFVGEDEEWVYKKILDRPTVGVVPELYKKNLLENKSLDLETQIKSIVSKIVPACEPFNYSCGVISQKRIVGKPPTDKKEKK